MSKPTEWNWQRTASSQVAHVWNPGKEGYDAVCKLVHYRDASLLIDANSSKRCKICLKVLACRFR